MLAVISRRETSPSTVYHPICLGGQFSRVPTRVRRRALQLRNNRLRVSAAFLPYLSNWEWLSSCLRRQNVIKNTTCDLSDWESSSLSLLPLSSDTISASTFSIYSRYGGYVTADDGGRRCNTYNNNDAEVLPKPSFNNYQQGNHLLSDEGIRLVFRDDLSRCCETS